MSGDRKLRMLERSLVVLFAGAALFAFTPNGPVIAAAFFTALVTVTCVAMGANVGEHFARRGGPPEVKP